MKEEIENGELLFFKVIGNLKAKSKISVNQPCEKELELLNSKEVLRKNLK